MANSLPILNDGTFDAAILAQPQRLSAQAARLSVRLPGTAGLLAGRYFLARCGAQTAQERAERWDIYGRRALFAAGPPRPYLPDDAVEPSGVALDLLLPLDDDPGHRWLAALPAGAALNLIGPLGRGFPGGDNRARNLLLAGDAARAAALLPLVEETLDRGGRVAFLYLAGPDDAAPFITALPLAVEVHVCTGEAALAAALAAALPWADRLCAALPPSLSPLLADTVRGVRLRWDDGFALTLVQADLLCGTGACLACAVPTASGGLTRACVHGPVFDLKRLVK